MFPHGEGWNESKEWVFAMETTSQGVFAIYEAEEFSFGLDIVCLPYFSKKKNSLECVLAFEQMVQQFEESSTSNCPDELKAATLIRCCHAKVREYLQLTVTDSTTYGDIRKAILSHDRASKVWSQKTVLRS